MSKHVKLMPAVRDNLIYLLIALVIVIYAAFFMGEQNIWWGNASILICVVIAILNIALILKALVAWYNAVEGDSIDWRIRDLENDNLKLKTRYDKKVKLLESDDIKFIRRDKIQDLLDEDNSLNRAYGYDFHSKLLKLLEEDRNKK